MPGTAALNIINLNIDSIQKEIRNYKTNRGRDIHAVPEDCTNRDAHGAIKQDTQQHQSQANKLINYFYSSNNTDTDKCKSNAMTQRIHEKFGDVFNGTGCFKGTFSLQLKLDSKPYQVPPRWVAYALQKLFKEELEHLQELDIIAPLGVDEIESGVIALCWYPKQMVMCGCVWIQHDLTRH